MQYVVVFDTNIPSQALGFTLLNSAYGKDLFNVGWAEQSVPIAMI